jgi:hypothetical protein
MVFLTLAMRVFIGISVLSPVVHSTMKSALSEYVETEAASNFGSIVVKLPTASAALMTSASLEQEFEL